MAYQELEVVVLTEDAPQFGLRKGDCATIVCVHPGAKAYELEFVASNGHTVALEAFTAEQFRPLGPGEGTLKRAVVA